MIIEQSNDGVEFLSDYQYFTSHKEDIDIFREIELDINNDNEPVLENIPTKEDNVPDAYLIRLDSPNTSTRNKGLKED